jgi:DNA processing protein
MSSTKIDLFDPNYPQKLRELPHPPAPLFLRGSLPSAPGVAVVGTRKPSNEGEKFAFALAAQLARAGLVVWSGGATGIDEAAHGGALSVGGSTVLVAGSGLEALASKNRVIFKEIARHGTMLGLVEDATPAKRSLFFERNSVLAAMTLATVVVECPLRSGARNTSASARKLGRPVWIAGQSPWSPFALAVREELRLGAHLLLGSDDLLASLPTTGALTAKQSRPKEERVGLAVPLDAEEQAIYSVLLEKSMHVDELCDRLQLSVAQTQATIMKLQLKGIVTITMQGNVAVISGSS